VDEEEDPEVVAYRRKRDMVDELIINPEMRYCYDIVASLMENEQVLFIILILTLTLTLFLFFITTPYH
jgi:hypothetical protein